MTDNTQGLEDILDTLTEKSAQLVDGVYELKAGIWKKTS